MRACALRYLSVDLYKTLVQPKEDIALTYTKFGHKHLHFEFTKRVVSDQLIDACSAISNKWPNFGRKDKLNPRLWWREVMIQTFAGSSPFDEKHVRNALSEDIVNEFYEWFSTANAWFLVPGTVEGLEKIKSAGIKLAVCSNSDERTVTILKNLGLDKFFDFVVYSRDCDYMKPNRGIFELVCNRFGEIASDKSDLGSRMKLCGHVGDSKSQDYLGARSAGFGRAFLFKSNTEKSSLWPYQNHQSEFSDDLASSQEVAKPKAVTPADLPPLQRWGVFSLRISHYLLARSGIILAIFLLCLLSERASRESQPPIHPWIIYTHAAIYMLTSTGMSARILPSFSVLLASAFYIHLAYLFAFEPDFGYPSWLRMRCVLRLLALAAASIRMLAVGDFDPSRISDKIGAGLSGCICAIMGLLSLPIVTIAYISDTVRKHEINSLFPYVAFGVFIHWVIGLAFCLAFLAYSFPVLVVLPSGQGQSPFFAKLVSLADKLACVGWGLTLLCKDINWSYWKTQRIDYWLLNTLILVEVITIASIVIGASLPWLGRITKAREEQKRKKAK
ncbi:unnamed protein product [Rodentolepis nana]|uniref:HAD-like domain-containing protein n=1 Tax=Rodentolepis nana TaxID=102285 RepID=A0A0R3T3E8_RODNA|nr:unnamed protein product [Rodentolepis nana]